MALRSLAMSRQATGALAYPGVRQAATGQPGNPRSAVAASHRNESVRHGPSDLHRRSPRTSGGSRRGSFEASTCRRAGRPAWASGAPRMGKWGAPHGQVGRPADYPRTNAGDRGRGGRGRGFSRRVRTARDSVGGRLPTWPCSPRPRTRESCWASAACARGPRHAWLLGVHRLETRRSGAAASPGIDRAPRPCETNTTEPTCLPRTIPDGP